MKADTQHLEFLISQYVDGTLEAPSRKSLEQQLANDPSARKLYKEHRDVQDVLDDFGNRIPLIDWDSFDKKLADRLDHEAANSSRRLVFKKWMRPVAAAAALIFAAGLGYVWHGLSAQNDGGQIADGNNVLVVPQVARKVVFENSGVATQGSLKHVDVVDSNLTAANGAVAQGEVSISRPDEVVADAMMEGATFGLRSVEDAAKIEGRPSSVTATTTQPANVPELP